METCSFAFKARATTYFNTNLLVTLSQRLEIYTSYTFTEPCFYFWTLQNNPHPHLGLGVAPPPTQLYYDWLHLAN